MENIGEDLKDRVRRLRRQAGLSQVSLSTLAGISSQTIKDIEAGRTDGGIKSLLAISRALRISVEDLFEHKEINVEKMPSIHMKTFVKAISSIPDDVYSLATQIDPEDKETWKAVRGALKAGIALKQDRREKKQG
jgi:DNA-binding XRE family transcriptional regulator